MAIVQDFTSYLWNWFIYQNAIGSISACWMIGFWGLFFDDDDGLMMNTCFELFNGSAVTFPVEYEFNWEKSWVIPLNLLIIFDYNIFPPDGLGIQWCRWPRISSIRKLQRLPDGQDCGQNINLNPTLIKNRILSSVNSMFSISCFKYLINLGFDPHFYFFS